MGTFPEFRRETILFLLCDMFLRPWTIIALHNFLAFAALSKFCLFAIPPKPYCANHLHKPVWRVMRCFPLLLMSSICLFSAKFSRPSFFIICLRKFIFHILCIRNCIVSIFSKNSLFTCSVHGVRNH